jgi:hypothetical protein
MANKLYVRGASGDVVLADLGITVAQGPSWTLLGSSSPEQSEGESGQFTARELRDSTDLYNAITGGTLDWSKDGSIVEADADYTADFMLMADFSDDTLDLSNGVLVFPQSTTLPSSGVEGQIYWDNDDDSLYIWNGSSWVSHNLGQVDHGGLGGLDDDDHSQYALLTGDLTRNAFSGGANFSTASGLVIPTGTDTSGQSTVEGNILWDTDDDLLYVYDGSDWVSLPTMLSGVLSHLVLTDIGSNSHTQIDSHISDSTIHFTEASIDHDNILNNGSNSHSAIDSHISDSTIHFTEGSIDHGSIGGLDDDDHPQYTDWEHDETVSGLWTFDPASTKPNLVLEPRAAVPSEGATDGALAIVDDILYAYDATRTAWLSVQREKFIAARHAVATNVFLRGPDGVPQSVTGYRMPRNGTIVALWAQTGSSATWTLEVYRSGSAIATLSISAASGDEDTTINVDVTAGDELKLRCNGTAIDNPVGAFEVAWRV